MKKYLKLLYVALFATLSLALYSCGDDKDEPSDPGNDGHGTAAAQYSFTINGTRFYYGCSYTIEGMEDFGPMYKILATYSQDRNNDNTLLLIDAQNTPLTVNEIGLPTEQDCTAEVEGQFELNYFDPKKARKGDILQFKQTVASHRKDSNDDKYLFDFSNFSYYYDHAADYNDRKLYTWRGEAKGTVRFVSYDEENDFITLEFDNVTLDVYQGYDYSDYPYKRNQLVYNGKIIFSSDIYN